MKRPILSLVVAAVAAIGLSASALASDWTVARSSGEVWIASGGVQAVSLGAGASLAEGGVITTGKSGRVLLVRGDQSMTIGPSSVVGVPDDTKGSAFTTILQKAGVVEFNVDKRKVKHFAVETPYLAAVVKGTHFVVGAYGTSGVVKVARGRVEVTDLRTGQHVDVVPGQQATVTNGNGLQIGGAGALDTIEPGKPRASLVGNLASLSIDGGVSLGLAGQNGVSVSLGSSGVNASVAGTNGVNASVGGNGVTTTVGGNGGVSVGVGGSDGVSVGIGGTHVSLGGTLRSLGL
jgi:hypothetical protein